MRQVVNRSVWLLALVLALAGADCPAQAQELKKEGEAFQQRLFGRPLDKNAIHVCFSRVYDAPHLAQHPRQNVRTMLLLVKGNIEDDGPNYGLSLAMTFRKSGSHFETGGNCGSIHDADKGGTGIAHCGVDCDGGQIDVSIKDEKSVLVSIPEGARVWRAGSENDSDEPKRFGADDKVFRLDKTALMQCLSLAADSKEKAAMRREK